MIHIGLTGWGDHPLLYSTNSTLRDKLFDYSGHFPIVELDTSFYSIPSTRNVEKWIFETPPHFKFIVKTFQGMTGHLRDENPFETREAMFEGFRTAFKPMELAGKLAMVLVQFPPWFDCQAKHVQYIRYIQKELPDFPLAIEFRNQTWYSEGRQDQTIDFLRDNGLIHTVCDEPQAGVGSVPFVAMATADKTLVRIHGRNIHGWRNIGNNEDWRKVRFLYDYNSEELKELAQRIQDLAKQSKDVYVLFNNNSGNHAAKNAKELQKILDLTFGGLAPKQLDIFEGDL